MGKQHWIVAEDGKVTSPPIARYDFNPVEEISSLRADLAAKNELAESLNRLAETLREESKGLRDSLTMDNIASLLVEYRIIDREAVEDPYFYDSGTTLDKIRGIAAALTGREG